MWLKFAGVIFVIAACAGLGMEAALRFKRRLRLLEKLKLMITHLKGEILYANVPLAEAFERTGARNPGRAGTLFQAVAARLSEETGERFALIWKEQAGTFVKDSELSHREREQLLSFGEHLGYLDREMQEKTLLLYLEDLEYSVRVIRKEEPEKCRLYMSLGLMSGLFLAVVLV